MSVLQIYMELHVRASLRFAEYQVLLSHSRHREASTKLLESLMLIARMEEVRSLM